VSLPWLALSSLGYLAILAVFPKIGPNSQSRAWLVMNADAVVEFLAAKVTKQEKDGVLLCAELK
jgi:hypothetical protein